MHLLTHPEIWFVTGSQHLYGPETLAQVARNAQAIVAGFDGSKRIPLDVSEGDVVIFSKYGGTEVKYDGQEYLLLNARDILAVVSK